MCIESIFKYIGLILAVLVPVWQVFKYYGNFSINADSWINWGNECIDSNTGNPLWQFYFSLNLLNNSERIKTFQLDKIEVLGNINKNYQEVYEVNPKDLISISPKSKDTKTICLYMYEESPKSVKLHYKINGWWYTKTKKITIEDIRFKYKESIVVDYKDL